eukprot:2395807-Karenia_brevis.AAC.1
MLPTPVLTLRIPEQLQMAHGRRVPGAELKALLEERMKTWLNPYLSSVVIQVTAESMNEIET